MWRHLCALEHKDASSRMRKLAAMDKGVEGEIRRLLVTQPERDLEAAVRVFETVRAARPDCDDLVYPKADKGGGSSARLRP